MGRYALTWIEPWSINLHDVTIPQRDYHAQWGHDCTFSKIFKFSWPDVDCSMASYRHSTRSSGRQTANGLLLHSCLCANVKMMHVPFVLLMALFLVTVSWPTSPSTISCKCCRWSNCLFFLLRLANCSSTGHTLMLHLPPDSIGHSSWILQYSLQLLFYAHEICFRRCNSSFCMMLSGRWVGRHGSDLPPLFTSGAAKRLLCVLCR